MVTAPFTIPFCTISEILSEIRPEGEGLFAAGKHYCRAGKGEDCQELIGSIWG